ncbi:SH2B adapter protein 1-like isoform X3 [Apostichopus japonicus]|uniref:SH2B adapter protein 1-like isoform X3 n=1 Tax=Stichopus japonicus TaxID=307972 RepID=UPI003AB656C8
MCPAIMEGSWAELCETEAIKAARVFAQTYHNYLASQEANGQTSEPDPEPSRVGQLFIEHFQEHFELELRRATIVINGDARVTPAEPAFSANGHTHIPNGTPPLSNGNSSQDLSREGSLGRNEPPPPAPPSFANRVRNRQADLPRKHSFRFWDKTSNIFEKFRRQGRARVANATNPDDVLREGHVSVMTGDDRLWDRSRLMLVKKESGYMLEFFSPPKSTKPRNGIFCFLIHEVRQATPLEVPGKDNTFVLKADQNHEFIIEASSEQDMNSWLTHIQNCRRQSLSHSGNTSPVREEPPANVSGRPLPTAPVNDLSSGLEQGGQGSSQDSLNDNHHAINMSIPSHYSSADAPEATPGPTDPPPLIPTDDGLPEDSDFNEGGTNTNSSDHPLADYPWFHESLTRVHAAQLVLQGGGADRHGVFLVRPSETRKGECVLTFNFHGRPKHLRLTLEADGKCKVTHLWFDSIFDMLAHFRSHPIPLDSKDGCPQPDVTLTEYVPNTQFSPPSTPQTPQGFNLAPVDRPPPTDHGTMPQSEFMEFGEVFEVNMAPAPQAPPAPLQRPVVTGMMSRTASNQYSFL